MEARGNYPGPSSSCSTLSVYCNCRQGRNYPLLDTLPTKAWGGGPSGSHIDVNT